MRKANPPRCRPRYVEFYQRAEWERLIDNFDRNQRKRNAKFRNHIVRIDHRIVGLITSDHKLCLSVLNELEPTLSGDN